MKVDIVNPLDIPDWDKQILRLPNYSFFHSSAWARVLSESYGYKPLYFTIFNDNAISACLPIMEVNSFITGKRGVSLPFTDYCEPLVDDSYQYDTLFCSAKEYARKVGWKYLELRGGRSYLGSVQSWATFLGHTLDLTEDPNDVFLRFRNSTRRNVKKAEKEGVKTEFSETMDAVLEFYRLNAISRRRHRLPPQPIGFFKAVHRHVISKNLGFVVLASHEGEVVAGSMFFLFGHKAVYKYGASEVDKQQFRPNNLVMWRAIRRLSENGFESVSFGRTEPQHVGLLQFKAGWRPTERPIVYYRYDTRMAGFCGFSRSLGRSQLAIFGKMPIPALNLIGSLAYKHMG